jgi:cytochrome c
MLKFYAASIAIFVLTVEARGGVLLDAVKAGDLQGAAAAITQGADVNEKTGLFTPLVAAVREANPDMAALLLDKGADPNKGAGSNTPLSVACDKGNAAIVQILLEKGADARFAPNDVTALHNAAESGCLKCVELLVGAGADVNALTSQGTPAIHLAKVAGHADVAAYLLAHGYTPPVFPPIAPALKVADAARGKSVYDKNCGGCHLPTGKPTALSLSGVVGRAKASIAGHDYSEAMKAAGGNWTDDELNAFIAHPAAAIPGTAMPFGGLPEAGERADLILYLHSHSDDP